MVDGDGDGKRDEDYDEEKVFYYLINLPCHDLSHNLPSHLISK